MEAWDNLGNPPQENLRAAQIQGISRRMMGMVRIISKLPTYRRRFRQVVKALITYWLEKRQKRYPINKTSSPSLQPRVFSFFLGKNAIRSTKPLLHLLRIDLGRRHVSMQLSRTFFGLTNLLFNRDKGEVIDGKRKRLKPVNVSPRRPVPAHITKPPYVEAFTVPAISSGLQIHDKKGIESMRASGSLAARVREYAGTLVKVVCWVIMVILQHDLTLLQTGNNVAGRMVLNQTFTIEPVLTIGSIKPVIWDDKWTMVTEDASLSAQLEHNHSYNQTRS
ncbi:methionine aminopeptidase 1D, chloroplastic/mitochondrial-like [Raphanus sativus]|uniref:Methionine aminopeptidase 1D, chloroplastic/mitochondrial-like n=1 Tax=Raphanus sativus TaxID=3726 RepID=A0A9W3DK52_RAPSA|nr:methionine aminopeptidase 1D, chloroplastic/mitochondrial-like [Raphanus sativus]